jgi:hypothetical protein
MQASPFMQQLVPTPTPTSPLQQILQEIRPGLTLYGVLLTFFVVAFAIGRHFWTHEKELTNEHSERIRDLLAGFRLRYIEPKINEKMDSAIDGAYESVIQGLLNDLYDTVPAGPGESKRVLISDDKLHDVIGEPALQERLKVLKRTRPVEMFLSSDSGQKVLADLDRMYLQKSSLARHYTQAKIACGRACYAWFLVALLMLIGITRVLGEWSNTVIFLWLIVSVEAAGYAIYSVIKVEVHRRKLIAIWEEFEFYGTI